MTSDVRRGQVQAHGALLALAEHDLAIAIASENTQEILGVPPDQLLTQSISAALEAPLEKLLRELPEDLGDVNPIAARTHDGRVLDVVLHRAGGMLVAELEPAGIPVRMGRVERALERLRGDVARACVEEIQAMLGFDRVAFYRGPGDLIAAVGEPPPYLEVERGERRYIMDRSAPTVSLVPAVPLHEGAGEVIGVTLRAVDAPGTGALLAISVGDRGVVVCEHAVACHVPYSARSAAQLIARMAGRFLGVYDGPRAGMLAGARVLIVDDEHEQGEILAMVLEAEGATIEIAASASAAMSAFRRFHPDAVVSDIGLPDKDGFELMRELRALGSEEGGWIPAISVSGRVGEELARQAMLAGFQLHIPKPIDPPALVARLARLVGRTVRRT
jgi:CheY-like chemotaxis protein